jgi:hypothetical protein
MAGLVGPPMTLGNMRANGVRSLVVACDLCHHETNADNWPDHICPIASSITRLTYHVSRVSATQTAH